MAAINEITDATFVQDVMKAKGPVLVDFWAPWCGPCRAIAPALEAIAQDRGDALQIVKVNADNNPDSMARFGVRGIPALFLVVDGKVAGHKTGAASKADLDKWIDETLAKPAAQHKTMAQLGADNAQRKELDKEQAEALKTSIVKGAKRVYATIATLQGLGGLVVALSATTPAVMALGAAVAAYSGLRIAQNAFKDAEKDVARQKDLKRSFVLGQGRKGELAAGILRAAFRTAANAGVAGTGLVMLGMAGAAAGWPATIVLGIMGASAVAKGTLGALSNGGTMIARMNMPRRAAQEAEAAREMMRVRMATPEGRAATLADPRVQKALTEAFEKMRADRKAQNEAKPEDTPDGKADDKVPQKPQGPETPKP